jgi:hypothetical protein
LDALLARIAGLEEEQAQMRRELGKIPSTVSGLVSKRIGKMETSVGKKVTKEVGSRVCHVVWGDLVCGT